MEDEQTRLLAVAQRCRPFAASISDPETIERLTASRRNTNAEQDAQQGPKDEKD
jgi:hypothetical protein